MLRARRQEIVRELVDWIEPLIDATFARAYRRLQQTGWNAIPLDADHPSAKGHFLVGETAS